MKSRGKGREDWRGDKRNVLVKGELIMKGGGACGRIGEEGVLVLVKGELRMKGGGACVRKEGRM